MTEGELGIAGMRIASILLGVLGGLGGLFVAWFLFAIVPMAGAVQPNVAEVMLYIVLALVVASVLCLVAGLLEPRNPIRLKLSLASGAIWLACAIAIVVITFSDANVFTSVADTFKLAAFVALPSVFPFANAALIARQGGGAG